MRTGKSGRSASIWLSPEQLSYLNRYARETGINRSRIVVWAIGDYFEAMGREDWPESRLPNYIEAEAS